MDHRSPLRDLTSLNIPTFEKSEMDTLPNDSNKKKPRFSVIKAFDPLYDSPHGMTIDIADSSNNSSTFEYGNGNSLNDENINPLFSTLVNISDTSNEFLIDDVENFIEEIIDEAIDNIFTRDNDQSNIIKQVPGILNGDSITCTECFNNETQLIEVKNAIEDNMQKDLEQKSALQEQQVLVSKKDEEIKVLNEKIFAYETEHVDLENKIKEYEEMKNRAEEQVAKYKDDIKLSAENAIEDNMQKDLEQKSALQEQQVLVSKKDEEIKILNEKIFAYETEHVDLENKIKEYEEAKNRAEEQVAKYMDDIKLSAAKAIEDNMQKDLEEQSTLQEQQVLMSKKDEEIKMLNEKIFVLETDLENKIKEYEDILGSQADLFKKQTTQVESLNEENLWAMKRLSNQEIAFGDVYDKYERSKRIVEGYKKNEEILMNNLQKLQDTLNRYEVWRATMIEAADVKYETWKREIEKIKEEYKADTSKLLKKIKHLEIKNTSLTSTLAQKTNECNKLTELCQEITDKC